MPRYDPSILQKYADRMYSQAAFWVVLITILVAGMGVMLGAGLGHQYQGDIKGQNLAFVGAFIGGPLGAILGVFVGLEIGFWIKLRAQIVLCQAQIEKHTRNTHATLYAMHERNAPPA